MKQPGKEESLLASYDRVVGALQAAKTFSDARFEQSVLENSTQGPHGPRERTR